MPHELYHQRVKDAMNRDVVTVHVQDTVQDALNLMLENKVSGLPVLDHQGKCVGMLSSRDFMDMTHELDLDFDEDLSVSGVWWNSFMRGLSENIGAKSVMDLMSEDVVSVRADDLLVDAARIMLREKIHRLPVLGAHNRLIGIISTTDMLRALVAAAPAS